MAVRIADILKQLRKASGMTTAETTKELVEYGFTISPKTLSGYESSLSTPNADMFMALCQVYGCDNPMRFFTGNPLEEDEQILLSKYSFLDDHGKTLVNLVLEEEFKRCNTPVVKRSYPYYQHIAAAGSLGFFIDSLAIEQMTVDECPGADFIIGVSGDSMEPTYSDRDLVYVKSTSVINYGEIGIFMYNGDCFIKEYGESGLISHNPKYETIPGNPDIRCFGIVLGKVEE